MAITAIQERSSITVPLLKELLNIGDEVNDVIVDFYLKSAQGAADTFCNNKFEKYDDDAGAYIEPRVEISIPSDVEDGIVEFVRLRLMLSAVQNKNLNSATNNLKLGDFSESKPQQITNSIGSVADIIDHVRHSFWASYRLTPGF